MESKKGIATININVIDKLSLKSIDKVRDFLLNYEIKVLCISAERTETSKNIHYHLLIDNYDNATSIILWGLNIWNSTIDNEFSYFNYMIKDGNYKLFNDYQKPIQTKGSDISLLLDDIYENDISFNAIRIKYPKLYLRYYSTIIKMYTEDYRTVKK